MFQRKKILVILLIASFLASIPISLLYKEPKITVVINRIEIGTDYGKPPGTPGGKPDKPDGGKPGDYKLMGINWYAEDLPLTLHVGDNVMTSAIIASATEWDSYTSANLVTDVKVYSGITIFDEVESNNPDYDNELIWANLESGTIAVCYTWYIGDKIVQFDIAFNKFYTWGDAESNSGLMDLQNIATHELGHGFGLADIYKRKLSDLTMYGYSWAGDTEKRDLAQGDIDGIQALYGVSP